jgi:FtsP/CotA-like multicopper oxidase with cupredoxin domain
MATGSPSDVLEAKHGQKVRLRVISAASDAIFTVARGGHRMTVMHSDGFPCSSRRQAPSTSGWGSGTTRS